MIAPQDEENSMADDTLDEQQPRRKGPRSAAWRAAVAAAVKARRERTEPPIIEQHYLIAAQRHLMEQRGVSPSRRPPDESHLYLRRVGVYVPPQAIGQPDEHYAAWLDALATITQKMETDRAEQRAQRAG